MGKSYSKEVLSEKRNYLRKNLNEIAGQDKMSGSLLYTLPLRVALPPLDDSIDRNMNIVSLDKSLSKELNISVDSAKMTKPVAEEGKEKANVNNTGYSNSNNGQETDGSLSMTSSEKQEWSVTLYDVDSKGSVSEEDLARLVTMLYKAAGASITKSPENSSKKIKLRLSVAPDPTKVISSCCGKHEFSSHTKQDKSQTPLRTEKENVTSQTALENSKEKFKSHDREKYKSLRSAEKSGDVKPQDKKEAKVHRSSARVADGEKSKIQGVHQTEKENLLQSVHKMIEGRHSRQRPHTHRKKPKKRQSNSRVHSNPEAPATENKDRRQYYQHLMGIESEQLAQNAGDDAHAHLSAPVHVTSSMRPGQLDSDSTPAVFTKSTVYGQSRGHSKKTTLRPTSTAHKQKQVHFESQGLSASMYNKHSKRKTAFVDPLGVDLHLQRPDGSHINNLDQNSEQCLDTSFDQELENQLDSLCVLKSKKADIPESMETISPHHLRRHRNREKDHIRAMKQVAKWIQQQPEIAPSSENGDTLQNNSVVVKHEHHHMHEHHHHYHFYHYYET